jgi:hypothetical protein
VEQMWTSLSDGQRYLPERIELMWEEAGDRDE